jgi:hypothetical protein
MGGVVEGDEPPPKEGIEGRFFIGPEEVKELVKLRITPSLLNPEEEEEEEDGPRSRGMGWGEAR